jgi:hypothetical protein
VTENFRRQPEHFHRIGVSASVQTLITPQCGQNGSPLFAANRMRWKVPNSFLVRQPENLSDAQAPCGWRYEEVLRHGWLPSTALRMY